MHKILFILILLIGLNAYGQSSASATASATIINSADIELDSLGNFKTDKYGRLVFKPEAVSKYEVVKPATMIEPVFIPAPKIYVSEKDSIRMMKAYIRKKKKYKSLRLN
jgi:hypothetical protein